MPNVARPRIQILHGHDRRYRGGYPWIYSNELRMDSEARALPPGELVQIVDRNGIVLGTAYFNPHSLIAARSLSRHPSEPIDGSFFQRRFMRALDLRRQFFETPFYRLIHAEADGFPGLIVDRYGDVLVVQANTAGMERLFPIIQQVMIDVLAPTAIVLRNDQAVRKLEGLETYVRLAVGRLDEPVEVVENGVRFLARPLDGQKTGWFFDLMPARSLMAQLAKGRRILDLYTHTGAFALRAAAAGAAEIVAIDRSEFALDLARQSARLNGFEIKVNFSVGDVFAELERRSEHNEAYDVVVADPPSFVKSKKELASGLKGYRKLARMAASLVRPGGYLFIASCSHHVSAIDFTTEVAAGVALTTREARIVATGGAGPDHPQHPQLAESVYIKWLVMQVDGVYI